MEVALVVQVVVVVVQAVLITEEEIVHQREVIHSMNTQNHLLLLSHPSNKHYQQIGKNIQQTMAKSTIIIRLQK